MKKYLILLITILILSYSNVSAEVYTFKTNLTIGSSDSEVTNLQTVLLSKGFDIPSINSGASGKGYFGLQTKIAVSKYQASVGLPNTGFVGTLTRQKLNAENSSTSVVTVTSPNGGESWTINSAHQVSWQINGNSNSDTKVDVYLTKFEPCPNTNSLGCYSNAFILDKNFSSNVKYNWVAGTDVNNVSIPRGSGYKIKVCLAGSTENCDSSDAPFALLDQAYEDNKKPVIGNISGPTSAVVGQDVTYTINAYDPEGGPIAYDTYWIKGLTQGGVWKNTNTNSPSIAFPDVGTYTVHTIVTDNVGKTAEANLVVNVR
jgi:peptidoglycan hydrolase-like protein with peptidoglycan-binding domain